MGLSGRKEKQRIGADPRNLSWADDAAKFGQSYLSKFGWDSSKGLGASGDGRLSHIKVSQKLDMLGIGAGHQKDPNGTAWKQNREFESLLKRLNENLVPSVEEEEVLSEGEDGKRRKRKREDDGQGKKKRKAAPEVASEPQTTVEDPSHAAISSSSAVEPPKQFVPRHRAHRARAIAAKSISSKSAAAISEILGIAPTPTSSAGSASASPGTLTPIDTLEKLTTSTKSVADYFKERLLAKSSGKSGSGSVTPAALDEKRSDSEGSYDMPRGGLGSSRLRLEITQEAEVSSMGPSKFAALMSSSFLAAASALQPPDEEDSGNQEVEGGEGKKKKKRRVAVDDLQGEHEEESSRSLELKKEKKRRKKRLETLPAKEQEDVAESLPSEVERKKAKEERRAARKEKKRRKEAGDSDS